MLFRSLRPFNAERHRAMGEEVNRLLAAGFIRPIKHPKLSLMPRTSALSTVQRHTAASRSTSPSSSGQHGNVGGTPTLALIRPSTLAHTPSFNASRGHLPNDAGVGVGVDGVGVDGVGVDGVGVDGVGVVGVGQPPPQALATENTTRFTARNSAIDALSAIASYE